MYDEIDQMLPIFKFLLATRKQGSNKTGMSSLRQSVSQTEQTSHAQSELDTYTKKFYDWLDPRQRSAIRLCMHWQASCLYFFCFDQV